MFANNFEIKLIIVVAAVVVVIVTAYLVYQSRLVMYPDPAVAFQDAPYRNPSLSIDQRVDDLLSRMTVAEKVGQMALVDKKSLKDPNDIIRYGIGALLSGGGANPTPNTPAAWLAMVNGFQAIAQHSRLGIPLLYGVDAVHGHSNIPTATIFPHAIGLGASRDSGLVYRVARATTEEMTATGIYWSYSPNLDVAQDMRWGRVYETFGSDTTVASDLGRAWVEGVQSTTTPEGKVIATAKHYMGSGDMEWGSAVNEDYKIDQGATTIDEATLRRVHLPPFTAAVEAGVQSVMVGLNSWSGTKLSASHYLVTDVLKGELGFKGFVLSDWYGVYEIPGGRYQAVVTAVNAGVDMVMLPFDYKPFVRDAELAVTRGEIMVDRLDDAVSRILQAKFSAGLFDRPLADGSAFSTIGSEAHRQLATEAVRKSLVLLKNDQDVLPLAKTLPRIIVAGSSAHNLGRQMGGWTVEWQGIDGNWVPGTTILDAIKSVVGGDTVVEYQQDGNFAVNQVKAEVGIAVVGEAPYSEGVGDNAYPALTPADLSTIAKVKAVSKKIVVVIVSGRPLDIRPYAKNWDAVVAAWLPGSEGRGVAEVLFGDYPFTGTLPVAWPLQ